MLESPFTFGSDVTLLKQIWSAKLTQGLTLIRSTMQGGTKKKKTFIGP